MTIHIYDTAMTKNYHCTSAISIMNTFTFYYEEFDSNPSTWGVIRNIILFDSRKLL